MARRLALLALLALAAAHAHSSDSASDSASFDPFVLVDDYDSASSNEPVPTPRPKISAKVILRAKGPNKVLKNNNPKHDNSVKNTVSDKKNKNKGAVINYTKIVAAKKPSKNGWKEGVGGAGGVRPLVEVSPQFVLLDAGHPAHPARPTHPARPARPAPPSTRRPPRAPATRKQTTRAPPKPTKKLQNKTKNTSTKRPRPAPTTTPCPPNKSGWFSSFFKENNKVKKVQKKPTKATWYTGLFSTVYNWIWGPDDDAQDYGGSWFSGGSWFRQDQQTTTTTTTTTTPAPLPTTTPSWFQNLLDTEDDGAYVINNTKTPKKAVKKTYKGYQLLRAYPDAQWKVHEMLELQEETLDTELKWWTPPSINGSTDILVPPDLLSDVKEHIKSLNIDFDVIIWDLQKAITYENPKLSKKQRMELEQLRGHPMTWRRYHRYADILRYLEYLQHSYSDLVELIPLGRSSEGLPLVAVKVALPNDTYYRGVRENSKGNKWKLQSKMKPAVWLEGGTHAREWIAPAVASWILHTIVEGEKGLGSEYDVLRQADFYIMPVMNPDGYEHSHTHDRLWRKTRSRHVELAPDDYTSWLINSGQLPVCKWKMFSTCLDTDMGTWNFLTFNNEGHWFPWNWGQSDCVGVDADRNWDYHWGEKDSSKDPCADNYAGPHPFSEPETRAVSAFLAEHKDRIKVYVSLHAYSQAWLIPSSHAHAPFADDGVLMEMGKLATAALADLYGTKYQVGTAAELRQPASGMAHDWAKARAGIKFSYHVNLRDSFGPYGFLLPGSQIVSTARETWQAVKTIVDNLH